MHHARDDDRAPTLSDASRGPTCVEDPLHLPSGSDLRRLLGVIASLFGYVALASLVGHLIASSLLSLALVHLLKPGSWPRTLVVGLAISLSAYALFVTLLAVPLPKGELGGWDR